MYRTVGVIFFTIILSISQVVTADLIGHWSLDEGAGTIADDIAFPSEDGTMINFPSDGSGWVSGYDGNAALAFDGSDDRVEMAGANMAAGFDVTENFTWCVWIKTNGVSGTIREAIINYSLPGAVHDSGNKILTLQPDGRVNVLVHGVLTADEYKSAVTVSDNLWHHLAVTVEHNTNGVYDTIRVYIDGDLNKGYIASNFDLTTLEESPNHIIILGDNIRAGKWAGYSGVLDEVRVYNEALGDSDIAMLAAVNTDLIGHWSFDESSGNTAGDSSVPIYDGTLLNFPADDTQWTSGVINGGLNFDGVDDWVEITGANTSAGFGVNTDFSWSVWVKSGGVGLKASMISFAPGGAEHVSGNKILSLNADGTVSMMVYGVAAASDYFSAASIDDNLWHHVAVTVQHNTNGVNDRVKIYIDGDLAKGYTAEDYDLVTGEETADHIIILGNNIKSGVWTAFEGFMDDVRVYSKTLSQVEVSNLYIQAVPSLTKAGNPFPTDTAAGVADDVVLSWLPGNSSQSHDLYFGQNYTEVLNADTSSAEFVQNQLDESFNLGSNFLLEPLTTYYWRIDEVNSASPDSPLKGDVWSFTVGDYVIPEFLVVEDFDDYASTAELLAAWDDGSTNPSGSTVSLAIPNSWMQLDYSGLSYSTYSFSVPQAWSDVLKSLSVKFKGNAANDSAGLYLEIYDGTKNAVITHPDELAVQSGKWQSWDIALSDFVDQGIDLLNVMSVRVGVASGVGSVLIDDIELYPERCIARYTPSADLNADCVVDIKDLQLLAKNWMLADYLVDAASPAESNLRAYYKLNETSGLTAADETGNNFDAQIDADSDAGIWQGSGYDGGCLEVDGQFHLILPATVFAGLVDQYTLCMWTYDAAAEFASDQSAYADYEAGLNPLKNNTWDSTSRALDQSRYFNAGWHHYAIVKDVTVNTIEVYLDGELISRNTNAAEPVDAYNANATYIGSSEVGTLSESIIRVDEVRVYDYALSHSEIVYLAAGLGGQISQPIKPVFSTFDPVADGKIYLADFAQLSQYWLMTTSWPR